MGPSADQPRYLPAEDTYLLRDALRSFSGRACLEIGFGSGVLVSTASKRFELAVGTDLLDLGQARLARGPGVDLVLADRAACFREGSFDLVFFNPPYVPSDRIEDRTVDGGPTGTEVPMAFVREGVRVLRDGGAMLALLSDGGDLDGFVTRCEEMGLAAERVSRKALFYENLVVFRLERRGKAKARRE